MDNFRQALRQIRRRSVEQNICLQIPQHLSMTQGHRWRSISEQHLSLCTTMVAAVHSNPACWCPIVQGRRLSRIAYQLLVYSYSRKQMARMSMICEIKERLTHLTSSYLRKLVFVKPRDQACFACTSISDNDKLSFIGYLTLPYSLFHFREGGSCKTQLRQPNLEKI